jgi:hypothetical protein
MTITEDEGAIVIGSVVIAGMPVIGAKFDWCEHNADVECSKRDCEQRFRPAQYYFRGLSPGFPEHQFVCIEHFFR